MFTKPFWLLYFSLLLFATSCKKDAVVEPPNPGGGNSGNNGGGTTTPKAGTPTAVGTPVGAATVATIGPAGGNITFEMPRQDTLERRRQFELHFPAGCFETPVQVSLQPIQNNVPNGQGLGLRLSTNQPGIALKKPAELTVTETPGRPNEPDVQISVQDPVIRIWKAARGRTLAPGKRRYKVHKAADWALFQNYQFRVHDYHLHSVTEDAVNGDHINLVVNQPLVMEVKRVFIRDSDIPLDDDSTLFLPVPVAETVGNDAINPIKWRFNGAVVSESTITPPAQSPQGWFVFEGARFETLRYTAPLVLQGDGSTPFDGRIEAEVRGVNNGPMMLLIQRIRVTNPNEYKLNGQPAKNAMAEVLGNSGLLSLMLKKNTDPDHRENIGFTSLLAAQPFTYELNEAAEGVNSMAATTHSPHTTYHHSYVDDLLNTHYSNGRLTVSAVRRFTGYTVYSGTFSSPLYDFDPQTNQLKTITISGKFEAVDKD